MSLATNEMLIGHSILGRYHIDAEIGRGGMGIVYRAHDQELDRVVALKSLILDNLSNQEKEDTVARFQREAQTSLSLRHPHIVQVFDFICEQDQYYLVMELLEGQTLKELQEKRQTPGFQGLINLMIQTCDGLHFAHQQGIIHRDIKPDNLLVTPKGQIKIMDFGIARQNNADHFLLVTQPGTMLGTLSYMSPEQLQDSAMVDARTDVFALGVIMYELFSGRLPFEGESLGQTLMKIITTPALPPREHNPEIPVELQEIILKALIKRRGQRYQSTHDLAQDLIRLQVKLKGTDSQAPETQKQNTPVPRQTFAAHIGKGNEDQTRPAMASLEAQLEKEGLSLESTQAQIFNDRAHGLVIECDTEGLNAWLTIDPTYAGEIVNIDGINELISKANLCYGLQSDVIQNALKQGFAEKVLIATGEAMIPGQSASLEFLIDEQNQGPAERQDGSVDHRDLRLHRSVKAGEPLIRKHPAIAGEAGTNIYGNSIPPNNVADCKLLEGPGTALASNDHCLLIASRDGLPIKMASSCRVESVLELNEVGLSTGNICFNGSVHIQGGVAKGFTVKAGGDLIVHGTVEDACLEAGGNLYLYAPVYGGSKTKLKAKYQLKGQFIQQAQIDCGGDLFIEEALMDCQTRAVGKVIIGSEKGHGIVNGGELYGTYLLQAKVLGSVSATNTMISIGNHPTLEAHLSDLEAQQVIIRQQMQENIKNMIYLRSQGQGQSERMQALESERSRLMFNSNTLTDEVQFLKDSLKQTENSKTCYIRITEMLQAGLKVHISGAMRIFDNPFVGPLTLRSTPIDNRNREVSIHY